MRNTEAKMKLRYGSHPNSLPQTKGCQQSNEISDLLIEGVALKLSANSPQNSSLNTKGMAGVHYDSLTLWKCTVVVWESPRQLMLTKESEASQLWQRRLSKGFSLFKQKYLNLTCFSSFKRRCIILSSQSTQVCIRKLEVKMNFICFPTQRWLFLLVQTINCHSLWACHDKHFFSKMYSLSPRMQKRKTGSFFPCSFLWHSSPAWDHIDGVRAEEKFRRPFPHSLTSGTLALS